MQPEPPKDLLPEPVAWAILIIVSAIHGYFAVLAWGFSGGRVDRTIQMYTGRSAFIAWCAGIIVTAGLLNQWPRWIVGLSSLFLVAMWAVTLYLVGRP